MNKLYVVERKGSNLKDRLMDEKELLKGLVVYEDREQAEELIADMILGNEIDSEWDLIEINYRVESTYDRTSFKIRGITQ